MKKGVQKPKLGLNRLSDKFHKLDLERELNIRPIHFTIQKIPQEIWHQRTLSNFIRTVQEDSFLNLLNFSLRILKQEPPLCDFVKY